MAANPHEQGDVSDVAAESAEEEAGGLFDEGGVGGGRRSGGQGWSGVDGNVDPSPDQDEVERLADRGREWIAEAADERPS
jgi:hypothetical protein